MWQILGRPPDFGHQESTLPKGQTLDLTRVKSFIQDKVTRGREEINTTLPLIGENSIVPMIHLLAKPNYVYRLDVLHVL